MERGEGGRERERERERERAREREIMFMHIESQDGRREIPMRQQHMHGS